MVSKIDELMQRLTIEGKLTVLSVDETLAINERITEQMVLCRRELAIKRAQSEDDLRKIILNA